MPSLELTLFGGFRARFQSGDELVPRSKKAALLLARLALRAGEVHTRETLIGLLWSDRAEAQARASLRQELTVLRKMMEASPPVLAIDGERLSLDATAIEVDVHAFEALAKSETTRDLERAASLYRGPLLEGFAIRDAACEEWITLERRRLRDLFLSVLDRLLARQVQEGAIHRAITTAQTLLAHDPLREDAHRTLMLLHAQQGRRSLALKQYQAFSELLRSELGVDPEPETVRLHAEIQAGRAAATQPPAIQAAPVGNGARSTRAGARPDAAAPPFAGYAADAYQFYQMGRSFFLRNVWGKGALEAARRLFEQAIEIDPNYARAYAGLADCDCYRLLLGVPNASLDTIAANVARALELGPDLAEGHAANGLMLYATGQHDAANAAFEHAVRLGPELFEVHYFYARNCRAQGLHEKAAELFERSAAINQNDFRALGLLVDEYRALGRLDDSLSAARRCLERINVEVAAQPDDSYALAFGSNILAELGERELAEQWAARAGGIDPDDAIVNYNLACTYAALDRPDAALDRLRATFGAVPINRRVFLEWMQHDTAIDPLRGHPGFAALVERTASELDRDPIARNGEKRWAIAAIRADDLTSDPGQVPKVQLVNGGTASLGESPVRDKRPPVAVLPFADLSGGPDQQYFSDGITEDIITELSRWRQLKVMSRNSSFRYRGSEIDVKQVRRELGVDYVVEGSVRRVGERIRVTAQLIDAETGSHVWAERYDRDLQELFAVQGEVVQTIVGTLVGRVQAAGAERAKRKPPSNLAAYDCVLRGLALPWGDPEADAEARRLYERAIELDPDYGLAHALLALMTYEEWGIDPALSDAALDRAFDLAKRAVELDENESTCQFMLGFIHLMRRSFDLAEQYHRRAVEMNPSNPQHLADMGSLLVYLGRPDEGLEWLDQARRVDPYFGPSWYWYQVGFAQMTARRYDEAIQAFERSTTMPYWVRAYIAACHARAGRMAQAKEWAAQALRLRPDFSATWNATKEPFKHQSDRDHLIEGLHQAGIPEFAAAQPATGNDRRTVAVLPFENLGGNPSEEYFSDGITDDIITELSRFHQLIVVARHSSFQYRDRSADVNRIGRELQVAYLVEGSIRRVGDRIRITAQLIETATGRHLWAERYDRSLHDLFDLQEEVARMIASALAVRIEAEDLVKAKRKPPDSMSAYDYWLRGKKCLDLWTPEANAEARRLFTKAMESDPDYARGSAGLAFTHEWAAYYTAWDVEGNSSHESARRYAERAVALDDTDHLPHVILGWVHHQRGVFEQAQQQFDRAIAINPNDADAIMHRAMVLALERRTDEAIENAELAMRLNPRHPDWYLAFLGACLFRAHRYADAAATWERAPDSIPEVRACLAAACVLTGRPHDARRHMEEFLRRFSLHWTGQPGVRIFVATEFQFEPESDVERFAAALREAGMPE